MARDPHMGFRRLGLEFGEALSMRNQLIMVVNRKPLRGVDFVVMGQLGLRDVERRYGCIDAPCRLFDVLSIVLAKSVLEDDGRACRAGCA